MIRKASSLGIPLVTDEQGNLSFTFDFTGWVCEIDIDFGGLEQETKVIFTTSNGRTFSIEGNNSADYPISPRKTINEPRFAHLQENAPFERYPNVGLFKIEFENAGPNKTLGFVEILYKD